MHFKKGLVMDKDINVFGEKLSDCCVSNNAGFFRTGKCSTSDEDRGYHTVCAVIDDDFLDYTASKGNDLRTPIAAYQFPGLKAGDSWCICASRWLEAYRDAKAPKVKLKATHIKTTFLYQKNYRSYVC